jgi:hypothetical protein
MGAVLSAIDNKNFEIIIAIFDKYGKIIETKELIH